MASLKHFGYGNDEFLLWKRRISLWCFLLYIWCCICTTGGHVALSIMRVSHTRFIDFYGRWYCDKAAIHCTCSLCQTGKKSCWIKQRCQLFRFCRICPVFSLWIRQYVFCMFCYVFLIFLIFLIFFFFFFFFSDVFLNSWSWALCRKCILHLRIQTMHAEWWYGPKTVHIANNPHVMYARRASIRVCIHGTAVFFKARLGERFFQKYCFLSQNTVFLLLRILFFVEEGWHLWLNRF